MPSFNAIHDDCEAAVGRLNQALKEQLALKEVLMIFTKWIFFYLFFCFDSVVTYVMREQDVILSSFLAFLQHHIQVVLFSSSHNTSTFQAQLNL